MKRRERVPHEIFSAYWRDFHGPLCSRLPGLELYIQHHFSRAQDAHLWPFSEGTVEIDNYELDGGVEMLIVFTSRTIFVLGEHLLRSRALQWFSGLMDQRLAVGMDEELQETAHGKA